jgi:hypothetical protein
MLGTHDADVQVLVAEKPLAAGSLPTTTATFVTWLPAHASGPDAGVTGRTIWTTRMSRLLNVVDVAVALPALIAAMAVWGVVTGTGHA